jgi:hypothetical protein
MKARSDSLFCRLKPAQREELLEMLCETGASVDTALKKCASWGVKTSAGAVSRFYSVHAFAWRLDRAKAIAEATSQISPQAIEEQKSRLLSQKIFEAISDLDCPPKVLIALRGLELKAATLHLAERRVKVLEAQLSEGKAALTDQALTPKQREAKLREVFGL